jgi:hypothetical protein
MNTPPKRLLTGLLLTASLAAGAIAQRSSNCETWSDPLDARLRPTDHAADGPLNPLGAMAEIVQAQLCAWMAFDPAGDPYTGVSVEPDTAHLFRLDLTFRGLINPPGPIGLGGEPFDPFRFGDSPLVGFVDIDADEDHNTGGELGSGAETRYLANVGRFGRRPYDSLGERAASSRDDLDDDFDTSPQYERSGADFALVLCGCFSPTAIEAVGDGDGVFEADETWFVLGRFFERAQGYRDASAAFGGSAPGLYDPEVELRFLHDGLTDETTVTLVWALDQTGAAQLAGAVEQPIDLDVANQASIQEALQDIIDGADAGGIPWPAWELVRRWEGGTPLDSLDISEWEITGIFGMPYAAPEETHYAWTDTLGEELYADMNGDLLANQSDETLIRGFVYDTDGEVADTDGMINGVVRIGDPGWNFSVFDTTGDDLVSLQDFTPYGRLGDFNDDGVVNTQDFIAFLNAWAAGLTAGDFNLDQTVNTQDFIAFLNAWAQG